MNEAMNIAELLLALPSRQREEKDVELPLMSKAAGKKIIFHLRALDYDQARHIEEKGGDAAAEIVLEGCVSPNFADGEFCKAQGCENNALEAVKRYFLPGELRTLAREIEHLSGYGVISVRNIKKK